MLLTISFGQRIVKKVAPITREVTSWFKTSVSLYAHS